MILLLHLFLSWCFSREEQSMHPTWKNIPTWSICCLTCFVSCLSHLALVQLPSRRSNPQGHPSNIHHLRLALVTLGLDHQWSPSQLMVSNVQLVTERQCVCLCVRVCVCACKRASVCVCAYVCVHVCAHVLVCMCMHMSMCECVCVCSSACMCSSACVWCMGMCSSCTAVNVTFL